jgi:glycosyltransferase involved in cell wall biosynthesis
MIVIDASPAVHRKAGLGRYAEELIGALVAQAETGKTDHEIGVFYHDALRAAPSRLIQSLNCFATTQTPYPWRLRALISHWLNLAQDELFSRAQTNTRAPLPAPRLFHATEHLLPRFKGLKTVFTLHDLIFKIFPEYHLPRNRVFLTLAMPSFLRRADAIICVSEHTKRDAMRIYRLPEDKLRVIHEGISPRFRRVLDSSALRATQARYALPDRFILAVGTIEPRKNLITLFKAFRALLEEDDSLAPELIVVGKAGWLHAPTFRAIHDLGLTGRVRLLSGVEDEELVKLYSLATVFAFPSLYEGFGLPPLEAMACGAPVVASNAASLPEVCGQAALLLPPLDVQAWTQTLRRVLTDHDLRRDLQARGPAQAGQFSWSRAAEETRRIYDELLR